MNTKNMITFESSYASDIERIKTISDLVCANYVEVMESASDYDTFMEAGDGFISTIKKSISAMIEKIRNQFNKVISDHRSKVKKKKIDRLYNSKITDIPKEKLGDQIEAVNIDAVLAGTKKCEQFTLKAISQVQKQMKTLMKAKGEDASAKAKEQLNALCDSLVKKQGEIVDEVTEISKKKETFTLREAYKMAMKHKEADREVEKSRDSLTDAVEKFNEVIDTAKSMINESADFFESNETGNGSNVKTTKSLWKRANDFIDKYGATMIRIWLVYLAVSLALSVVVSAAMLPVVASSAASAAAMV